jgi:hypothetical protein
MQRSVTVLLASLLAGLLSTGCPEKRVEKEEPAAPSDQSGAEVKAGADKAGADKAAADEERPDEGEEHGEEAKDDRKPLRKKTGEKKKEAAPEEKDQGGW